MSPTTPSSRSRTPQPRSRPPPPSTSPDPLSLTPSKSNARQTSRTPIGESSRTGKTTGARAQAEEEEQEDGKVGKGKRKRNPAQSEEDEPAQSLPGAAESSKSALQRKSSKRVKRSEVSVEVAAASPAKRGGQTGRGIKRDEGEKEQDVEMDGEGDEAAVTGKDGKTTRSRSRATAAPRSKPSSTEPSRNSNRNQSPSPGPSHSHSSNSQSGSESDSESEPEYFNMTSAQSRSVFLRNESKRKLNEARNFYWEGDVREVRRLRSGRAVKNVEAEEEEQEGQDGEQGVKEYQDGVGIGGGEGMEAAGEGGEEMEVDDLEVEGAPPPHATVPQTNGHHHDQTQTNGHTNHLPALSPFAITYLNNILQNLSPLPSLNPVPFDNESPALFTPAHVPNFPEASSSSTTISAEVGVDKGKGKAKEKDKADENEALTQLVNLLRGTVDRGEGNSCLVVGAKGSGKTRTVNRAIQIVKSTSSPPSSHPESTNSTSTTKRSTTTAPTPPIDRSPIIVRLDGLAQTNDALAIREMGRQIDEEEGKGGGDGEEDEDEGVIVDASAPTTLPSQLLAYLTASSPRAIVVVIENFDLFTEHARQALLYCLLDVVQSVRTGPVESTGRGLAVVGVTSRVDTPLLLEKRVKSRFSQRIFRVVSPLAVKDEERWEKLLGRALLMRDAGKEGEGGEQEWAEGWEKDVEQTLDDETVRNKLERLCSLTTDPRILYRPFMHIVSSIITRQTGKLAAPDVVKELDRQLESTGWMKNLSKLQSLSQPDLVILIIAKHFAYAGKEEFNFAMAEHEYQRFSKNELAGSGRARWSGSILEKAWEHLLAIGLLFPASRLRPSTNPHMHRFLMCRSLLSRNEIVSFFKGEGGKMLGTELANWGRVAGGHA